VTFDRKTSFILVLLSLVLYIPYFQKFGIGLTQEESVDFPSFYWAPVLAFEDKLSPFTGENWDIAASRVDQTLWAYLYPPPSLPIFRILNAVPYETAKIGMIFFSHVLLIGFLFIFLIGILKPKPAELFTGFTIAYTLSYLPVVETIRHGQVNLLVLMLMLVSWYFLTKSDSHPALVAIPLVLAAVLKLYPALIFIYLLLKGKYKIVLWGIGTFLIISLLSTFFLPAGSWMDWFQNVANSGYGSWVRGIDPAGLANQSINGFTSRLFLGRGDSVAALLPNPLAGKLVPYLLNGIVLVVTVWACWRWQGKDNNLNLHLSAYLLTMALVAPLTWEHQLVFVLPAILVTIYHLYTNRPGWFGMIWVGAAALLVAMNFPYLSQALRAGFLTVFISTKLFAVGMLWLFTIFELYHRKSGNQLATSSQIEPLTAA
jgi:hypothetical protein